MCLTQSFILRASTNEKGTRKFKDAPLNTLLDGAYEGSQSDDPESWRNVMQPYVTYPGKWRGCQCLRLTYDRCVIRADPLGWSVLQYFKSQILRANSIRYFNCNPSGHLLGWRASFIVIHKSQRPSIRDSLFHFLDRDSAVGRSVMKIRQNDSKYDWDGKLHSCMYAYICELGKHVPQIFKTSFNETREASKGHPPPESGAGTISYHGTPWSEYHSTPTAL